MALLAAGFAPVTTVRLPNFKPQQRPKSFIIAGPKRSTIGGGSGGQTNSISIFEESKIVISNTETKKGSKKSKAPKREANKDETNNSG